jgi:hypothetical protein
MPPMISASRVTCWFAIEFRTSFVHRHRTPIEYLSIQCSDGSPRFSRLRHLDKSDTTGLARVSVHDDRDGFDGSMRCKNFSQLLLCYRDIKVPDKNVGHGFITAIDLPGTSPLETEAGLSKRRS